MFLLEFVTHQESSSNLRAIGLHTRKKLAPRSTPACAIIGVITIDTAWDLLVWALVDCLDKHGRKRIGVTVRGGGVTTNCADLAIVDWCKI